MSGKKGERVVGVVIGQGWAVQWKWDACIEKPFDDGVVGLQEVC